MWLERALRVVIIGVAGAVLVGLAPVIVNQWTGVEDCPMLGPLPACYVVGASYTAMAIAAIVAPSRLLRLFLIGWTPVFLLALTGTSLELSGTPTCPRTSNGIAMCYLSLTIALVLLPTFLVARRLERAGR